MNTHYKLGSSCLIKLLSFVTLKRDILRSIYTRKDITLISIELKSLHPNLYLCGLINIMWLNDIISNKLHGILIVSGIELLANYVYDDGCSQYGLINAGITFAGYV